MTPSPRNDVVALLAFDNACERRTVRERAASFQLSAPIGSQAVEIIALDTYILINALHRL
jgi:hypothetical protein